MNCIQHVQIVLETLNNFPLKISLLFCEVFWLSEETVEGEGTEQIYYIKNLSSVKSLLIALCIFLIHNTRHGAHFIAIYMKGDIVDFILIKPNQRIFHKYLQCPHLLPW